MTKLSPNQARLLARLKAGDTLKAGADGWNLTRESGHTSRAHAGSVRALTRLGYVSLGDGAGSITDAGRDAARELGAPDEAPAPKPKPKPKPKRGRAGFEALLDERHSVSPPAGAALIAAEAHVLLRLRAGEALTGADDGGGRFLMSRTSVSAPTMAALLERGLVRADHGPGARYHLTSEGREALANYDDELAPTPPAAELPRAGDAVRLDAPPQGDVGARRYDLTKAILSGMGRHLTAPLGVGEAKRLAHHALLLAEAAMEVLDWAAHVNPDRADASALAAARVTAGHD